MMMKKSMLIVPDSLVKEFLSSLREYRNRAGLTQKELAESTGILRTSITCYERKKEYPTLNALIALSESLNADISGSLNYQYYHHQINFSAIKKRLRKVMLSYRELSDLTGYSLRCICKTLNAGRGMSLSCLKEVLDTLDSAEREQKFLDAQEKLRTAQKPAVLKFTPEELRKRRQAVRLTQRALAKLIGMHHDAIVHYESGKRRPKAKIWRRILSVLNSPDRLKPGRYYLIIGNEKRQNLPQDAAPESGANCIFRYEGKRNGLYCFTEKTSKWTKTLSESQMIGKTIRETGVKAIKAGRGLIFIPEYVERNVKGLRSLMESKSMRAKEISLLTGVSIDMISKYEKGQNMPSPKNYNKLAEYFGWEKWE